MITIQIVTYNSEKVIKQCLDSLFHLKIQYFEIIILDNASKDQTTEILEEIQNTHPNITLIKSRTNMGFAKAHNKIAKKAKGSHLIILNPDTVFLDTEEPKYLEKIITDNHVFGFKFKNQDNSIQYTIGKFPNLFRVMFDRIPIFKKNMGIVDRNIKNYSKIKEVDWLCGCGFLISKKDFLSVKGFNEEYFLYCEEIELFKKLNNKGIKVFYDPNISFIHLKESRDKEKKPKKYFYMRKSLMIYFKNNRNYLECKLLHLIIKLEALINVILYNKDTAWLENIKNVLKL